MASTRWPFSLPADAVGYNSTGHQHRQMNRHQGWPNQAASQPPAE